MTTGFSGTYAFNDIDLTLPPTSGKWVERTSYGVDGNGHPVYSQFRKFEMAWDLISTTDVAQVIGFYNAIGNTGTVTVCLPDYGNVDFIFRNYSGCTMQEPTFEPYFQGYVQNVRLLIMNVQTN